MILLIYNFFFFLRIHVKRQGEEKELLFFFSNQPGCAVLKLALKKPKVNKRMKAGKIEGT